MGNVNLLAEAATEVNSTGQLGERGQVNDIQLVVTGNGETTVDGLEVGDGDVGQLGVVVEDHVTASLQLGGVEGLELGTPEAELTVQVLQRGHGDGADVTEGQTLGVGQVGQRDFDGVTVERQVDDTGGVDELVQVGGLQVSVGLDVELADHLKADTVKRGQTGVGDGNIAGLVDTLLEGKAAEGGQGVELDLADRGELGEAQFTQDSQVVEGEVAANGAERVTGDGAERRGAVAHNVTGDLLDAIEGKALGVRALDGQGTVDGLARLEVIGIALGFDGGVTAVTLGEDEVGGCQCRQQILERKHCNSGIATARQPRTGKSRKSGESRESGVVDQECIPISRYKIREVTNELELHLNERVGAWRESRQEGTNGG